MGRWLTVNLILACFVTQAGATDDPPAPSVSPEAFLASAARDVEAGNLGPAIGALLALEMDTIPPSLRRQGDLLLGILLLRQGQRDEAIPRLERAAATYPLLADYALWHLAGAYRKVGQRAAAAGALRLLLNKHPESLFAERASRALPRDWMEAGDLTKAEEAVGAYLAAFPQAPGRAEVWVALGEVMLRSGRVDQAEEILRRVWVELPASPESQRAKDLLTTIPDVRPFSPDEEFQRATTLHRLGRNVQALLELAPFAVTGNPREAEARLLLGIGAFRLRQYSQAVQWLVPLKDGAGAQRGEVLYWLGRSLGRLGDSAGFAEQMNLLADTAPQTRWAEEGLYFLAQAAADSKETAQARAHLARLLRDYPRSAWRDVAIWLEGWLAYKERDLDTAIAAWERLLAEEPGSRLRTTALYWRGRALEAARRMRDAADAYRTILQTAPDQHYYGYRAAGRLQGLGKPVPRSPAATAKRVMASNALHLKKGRALRSLGLGDEAVEEYSEQVRTRPEDRGGLAEACRAFVDLQRYSKAVWLAGKILRPIFVQENGQPPIPEFWQCLYPLGHWPLVGDQAQQQGLDPYLVTALIREESAFGPQVVSRAGARGLMQLMPQTAEQVVRDYRLTLGVPAPLDVPEVNVWLGTIHLAELIRDNGGNLTLAVASYNAGIQAVRRWRDRFGFLDEEEFTEDIPYTETRNYVKRVLGSYERYKTLYGQIRAESAPLSRLRHAVPGGGQTERGGRVPGTPRVGWPRAENKKPGAEKPDIRER